MKKFSPYQEESLRIFKQTKFFNIETNQLLHQQFLVLYPQLNEKELNQIIQNVVNCLSSLILVFKTIPLTIKQIGVESMVQGKQKTFYFQINKIERNELSGLFWKNNYNVKFDMDKCFIME